MQRKLRIGIIGAGGFGGKMIASIKRTQHCEVQAVMVRDSVRAKEIARVHGIPEHYDSVEALVGSGLVEAVYVASPDHCHFEHVLLAARYGKHVLCEKPMGLTRAECVAMDDACVKAGVMLMPGFMLRFVPRYQEVRKLVSEGTFGKIVSARVQCAFMYPHNGSWRQNPHRGGGALWDLGSHAVDLLRFLLMDEVVAVQALIRSAVHDYPGKDTAVCALEFARGAIAIIDVSFGLPLTRGAIEIHGTKATLFGYNAIDQRKHPAMTLRHGATTRHIIAPAMDRYISEFDHFAQSVRGEIPPSVTAEDGVATTRVLEACEKAARLGQSIKLE